MKHYTSHSSFRIISALFVLVAVLGFTNISGGVQNHSVEVGFTNLSPAGESGGRIIPASCNGAANAADYGQGCTSAANSCGMTNSGTYDTCGNCTAATPSNTLCPQPPTVTIIKTGSGGSPGSSATILVGDSVTINWSCPSPNTSASGATTGDPFSTAGASSGSKTVTVTQTSTFTVICDQTHTQASVTATAVNPALSLVAAPSRVRSGNTTTLTWSASSVTSCVLSGPSVSVSKTADGGGNIATQNTTTAAITGQSTYRLLCQTPGGAVSTSVNVSLIPVEIEI